MSDFPSQFFALTDQAESILITSHFLPDDDSVGSILLMRWILREKYPQKRIEIRLASSLSDRWQTFSGYDDIKGDSDPATVVSEFDLLVVMDGNSFGRFSRDAATLSTIKNTVCIDHHASQPDKFTLSHIEPDALATCEVIYRLFLHDRSLPAELAELVLLGLLGDTGDLQYVGAKTSRTIYPLVSRLLEILDLNSLKQFTGRYAKVTIEELAVIKELMSNLRVVTPGNWPPLVVSYISREFVAQTGASLITLKAGIDRYMWSIGTKIDGTGWAIALIPTNDRETYVEVATSMDGLNARLVMSGMGIGGGHDNSAGGMFKEGKTPEECAEELVNWLTEHQP